jgi:hypothetical protein
LPDRRHNGRTVGIEAVEQCEQVLVAGNRAALHVIRSVLQIPLEPLREAGDWDLPGAQLMSTREPIRHISRCTSSAAVNQAKEQQSRLLIASRSPRRQAPPSFESVPTIPGGRRLGNCQLPHRSHLPRRLRRVWATCR